MSRYIHTTEIHNTAAASQILPEVFRGGVPKSVLDVGCGLGTWLAVAKELGVSDITGVEGPGLDSSKLVVPADKIAIRDLTQPFSLDRKFDLGICLEVAEHLPPGAASTLVDSLVRHSDNLLFSAAIPGQGGQHHLNEQWPAYWQEKFAVHGYYFEDLLRPVIWDNAGIEWWYRQNIFIVRRGAPVPTRNLSMIHPELHALRRKNEHDYHRSLLEGRQGLGFGGRIFFSALIFKLKNLFGGKPE